MRAWYILVNVIALLQLQLARAAEYSQSPLAGTFTTFNHPDFPSHSVRIKEQNNEVCDSGSKQYTGWLDFNGKHLFFWMLLELGPCRINTGGNSTHQNPYSWTKNSSMIFIDQPAGTGLSYIDPGTDVPATSQEAAADMYIFLQIFLSKIFPERRAVPFHIAGESYGGHYIPTLSAEILRQNQNHPQRPKIPLASILIGNGFVSPQDTTFGYYETLCTTKPGVDEPVFNKTRCKVIAEAMPRCLYLYDACYQFPDKALCKAADEACGTIQQLFYGESHAGGRDPFDITRVCEVDRLCYKAVLDIQHYINKPSIWKALGVPQRITNFSIESKEVASAFEAGIDSYTNVMDAVKFNLETGVDVLIYNGNLDLACNTAGNLQWTNSLRWNGQAEFVAQDMKPWTSVVEGEKRQVGKYKEVYASGSSGQPENRRFAFVTIDRSGHMVPFDQPAVALDLFQRWLFRQSLSTGYE